MTTTTRVSLFRRLLLYPGALLFVVLALYRRLRRWRYPRVTCHDRSTLLGFKKRFLARKRERYASAPWWTFGSGLLQTICSEIVMSVPKVPDELRMRRETIRLSALGKGEGKSTRCRPDVVPEGIVSLDWVSLSESETASTPDDEKDAVVVVILIPGLTGSSSSGYVRRCASHLLRHNRGACLRVAIYNPRGRGGNELLTPFLYSAGYTEDVRRVVEHVAAKTILGSTPRVFAVGYSLGSNVLAKMLGEDGDSTPLTGAVCVACPIDCLSSNNHLRNTWIGQLMDRVLVRFVHKVVKESRDVIRSSSILNLHEIESTTSMSTFDRFAVAPLMGCDNASDYYRAASSGPYLTHIRTPTLFLHAYNDPIVPGHTIRTDNFRSNPHLLGVMTREGGHSMDWPMHWNANESWSPRAINSFIEMLSE